VAAEKYGKRGTDNQDRTRAKLPGVTLKAHLLLAGAAIFLTSCAANAQQTPDKSNLPDSPKPQQNPNGADQNQQKNILATPLGLITRRSYMYPELATTPGPLSSLQKFELFLDKSVSPPQFLGSLAFAGISQARNTLPGYGQEGSGFGKRFGSSMATGVSSHFFGSFLLPSVLHEDPRFFVKLNGGFKARAAYALRRALVTRTDAGMATFNWAGTLGPLAAEGLANTYLPDAQRTVGNTFERYGVRIGFSAANNLLKEYWPTIFKRLRIGKVAPGLQPDTTQPTPPGGPPNVS
jgi:hypothetical protein